MGWKLAHAALHAQGISPTEKIVLIALADYANDKTGECWPSQRSVANLCGLSRKSVNESVSKLAKLGFVEIIPNDGYASTYRVNLTSADAPHGAKSTPKHEDLGPNGVSPTVTGVVTQSYSVVSPTVTQTYKGNKEKNISTQQISESDRQTRQTDNVCLFDSHSAGDVNFDWKMVEQRAVAVLIANGYDAEEAAGRVAAVKEQVSKIAKEREKGGWRNQNGERILHPQQHLIGTFVGLARKIQYQPPHITHEELEREVFDPANKHRFSGALNPLGFIADDNDTDAFWGWLVAHDFKNRNHEVITRKNFWGSLHAFMAIHKKDLIDFFAGGCRTQMP